MDIHSEYNTLCTMGGRMMENLVYKDHEYRIKKMNAIELMAMQSQMSFKSYETTQNFYKLLLENMEVCINEKWLPVKEKGREVYYPDKIDEDIEGIEQLLSYYSKYLKSVFQKSNGLKEKVE